VGKAVRSTANSVDVLNPIVKHRSNALEDILSYSINMVATASQSGYPFHGCSQGANPLLLWILVKSCKEKDVGQYTLKEGLKREPPPTGTSQVYTG
jgi:hypothetical protein